MQQRHNAMDPASKFWLERAIAEQPLPHIARTTNGSWEVYRHRHARGLPIMRRWTLAELKRDWPLLDGFQ